MTLGSHEDYVRGKVALIKEQLGVNEVVYDLAGIVLVFDDHTIRISQTAILAMSTLMREAEEHALAILRAEAEERAVRRIALDLTQKVSASEQVHG
jgi:hypothetical protein